RLLQLQNNEAGPLHLLLKHRWLLPGLLPSHFGRRIELNELASAEPHGFEPSEFLFYQRIGNPLRAKLFIQIGANPEAVDFLDLFSRRPEARPIEEVNDLLLLVERHRHEFTLHVNSRRLLRKRDFESSQSSSFPHARSGNPGETRTGPPIKTSLNGTALASAHRPIFCFSVR